MKEVYCCKCKAKFDTSLLGDIKFCPFCGSKLGEENNSTKSNIESEDKYKKFYKISIEYLNSIKPDDIDVNDYFERPEYDNFRDILICFISTLQDYQAMPNVIGFNSKPERKHVFKDIFFNYDHNKILEKYDEDSLYNM